MQYLNSKNLPVPIAVFLATEKYDYDDTAISATSFTKSIRQLILKNRIPEEDRVTDVNDLIAARIGTAIHDAIENSWKDPTQALKLLGYPEKTAKKFIINPEDPAKVPKGAMPVYMEQRWEKEVMGYYVSGKADLVLNGNLFDYKTTSTYSWNSPEKEVDYQIQGSIYRWLRPDIIKSDWIDIIQVFLNWEAAKALGSPDYPPNRIMTKRIPLMPLAETERYVKNHMKQLLKYMDSEEEDIPFCDDKALWRKPSVFKYYKNPEKTSKSTKNFRTYEDAIAHKKADGDVGLVREVRGTVGACKYCEAVQYCSQARALIASEELVLTIK